MVRTACRVALQAALTFAFACLTGANVLGAFGDASVSVGRPEGGGKKITIGLVAKSQSNPVFLAARTGAIDAAKELGPVYGVEVEIDWQTPTSEDAQRQAELIEQLVNKGVGGIAVSCSDAATLTRAIDGAVGQGVPVVCFDSDAPKSGRFAFYGVDDVACGKQIAQELAKEMGGKGVVAILAGNQTAPNLQTRVKGVKEALAAYPEIQVLEAYYHKETAQDAVNKLEEVQRTHPEITGWAMVGGWPLFTKNALDNIAPYAKVVAVDALRPQLAYLENGQAQVLLAQKVYEWGYESTRLLLDKIVKGRVPADPVVKSELVRVTKENAAEYGRGWGKWLGEEPPRKER
jgi:ribose transport system substrate-binding protein